MDALQQFIHVLDITWEKKYSDVHLATNKVAHIRNISGDIIPLAWETSSQDASHVFSHEDIIVILKEVLQNNYDIFLQEFEYDTSYKHTDGMRYRVNCYKDANGYAIAMRQISEKVTTLDELGFWDTIKNICKKSKGLILMTGPTGTGKSTNLAAMVEYINENFKKHIITIEDPIEFVFHSKQSHINQREIWVHTKSFPKAIKSCLREDPNVIMLWEMRDPETIQAAITLAETGHLVLSSLHTNDTVQSIDRIVDVFPTGKQEQIRMQLAMSLVAIISQRLVPRSDKDERIAAREVLFNNDAVRNLIITKNTHQLYSVIEIWQKQWMILMDNYLIALYKKWLISKETLESYARDKENIELLQTQ